MITEIENKILNHQDSIIRRWQNSIWWWLFLVVPVTILICDLILIPGFIYTDDNAIKLLSGMLFLIVDGIFINLIRLRFWDEKNIEAKRNSIPIPNEFKKELDELK